MANLYTFHDVQTHLLELCGGSADDRALRIARRAIQESLRTLPARRNWTYYYLHGRLTTDDDYSTGTVEYDYTGGANERQLTLSGGTWPTNAAYGKVLVSSIVYEVDSRVSNSIVTLKSGLCPTADIAAGTSYQWYRDTYTLPETFHSMDQLVESERKIYPEPVTAGHWLDLGFTLNQPAQPRVYSIMGDPDVNSRLALRFSPAPDDAYNFDYIYKRRPRPLVTADYSTGTVSCSASTTVTGSGTSWTSSMVGAVIRFGTTSTVPTGVDGASPYQEQAVVTAVGSATSLTVDVAPSGTYSAVKYRISDWIDVEDGAMYTAFLRGAEYQFAEAFPREDAPRRLQSFERALLLAKESDKRHFDNPASRPLVIRSQNMPQGADQNG